MLSKSYIVPLVASAFLAISGTQSVSNSNISSNILAADATLYAEFESGMTVEDLISSGKGFDAVHNEFILTFHPAEENPPGSSLVPDPLTKFRTLVNNSTAVIIGTPVVRQSALTSSHHFVFSDYEVQVDSILFSRDKNLHAGRTVILTRPGGEVSFEGAKVRAIETQFPLFRIDEQYIFFLHKAALSGSFLIRPNHAYLIQGSRLIPGRRPRDGDPSEYDLGQVENTISSISAER